MTHLNSAQIPSLFLESKGIFGSKPLAKVFSLLLLIGLVSSAELKAQKVYSADAAYKADVKVFVVDAAYKADLLVYKQDKEYKAKGNQGLWFFTNAAYKADKIIYFVDAAYKADLKIYFTDRVYKAKWEKSVLIHTMY